MNNDPTSIVLFGSAGDLVWRKLIPSLFDLYREGRMPERFAVLVVDRLPFRDEDRRKRFLGEVKKGRTYEDYLGLAGLKRLGTKKWRHHVGQVVRLLKNALGVDYVVLGGGNARLLKQLPPGSRLGNNTNAFLGGYRLWSKTGATSTRGRFVH